MSASPRLAWWVFAFTSAAIFGNYYVYDSIGPVADMLSRQLGYSDTQIGTLNAIYSAPNIVLVLVGGILTDRFGPARITFWTAVVCALGAFLTAVSGEFWVMTLGRFLFGVGAETMIVATLAALGLWFGGRNLAFAMAAALSIARLGSYSADTSPVWASDLYANWQSPLWLAMAFAVVSVVAAGLYWRIDRAGASRANVANAVPSERVVWRDLLRFGRAYWFVLALSMLFYSVIFPFRSTFAIKYFQDAHAMSLADAGTLNSYVFLTAAFATPLFGLLADRVGRHGLLLTVGASLLVAAFVVLILFTAWPLGINTALIGISFSLVPAVLWPAVVLIVEPQRLGTAYGLMTMVQNIGMAAANLIAGGLNDAAAAGPENPAGYTPMLLFFAALAALGVVAALLFWNLRGQTQAQLKRLK